MAVRDWPSFDRVLSRRRVLSVAGGLLGVAVLLMAGFVVGMTRPLPGDGGAAAPRADYLRIVTGSVAGTNYSVGGALARLVSQPKGSQPCERNGRCGVPGLSAVALASEGAVANVQLVAAGLAESALVQADILANAAAGRRSFERAGALTELRAIANLYPEALHLVVAKGARVAAVRDLRGKRVSIDRPRSGANADARLVLDHLGVAPGALKLYEVDAAEAAEMLLAGRLDAFFVMGSWPVDVVADLAERGAIALLPLPHARLGALFKSQPFLHGIAVPAGAYPGLGEIETVGADAIWITRADVSQELVYGICRALFSGSNRPVIAAAHPIAALIELQSAAQGLPVPLAEGAEKFYREASALGTSRLAIDMASADEVPMPRASPLRESTQ